MNRNLYALVPEFREKVEAVLADCKQQGFDLRPFCTQRTVDEQARLWRQSRSKEEIDEQVGMLRIKGATWLAQVMQRVGPQYGRHVTNALPGASWHNWSEAIDCFVYDTVAVWDADHPGYAAYATAAKARGLEAGFYWSRFQDAVHVQQRHDPVLKTHTWEEVDGIMRAKFGE